MEGDYSRDTFDRIKHFSRVLMQQGRVQLDADWNEQGSILLHYLRTLAVDLIGQHGGPADELGFEISPRVETGRRSLEIGFGRYYVDGILCENEVVETSSISGEDVKLSRPSLDYFGQPDYPLDSAIGSVDQLPEGALFVYLDVWERHITYLEDDSIREVALGGPDTAARTKTVWQVKVKPLDKIKVPNAEQMTCDSQILRDVMSQMQPANRGLMAARAQIAEDTETDVCIVSPEASYRGRENQNYRVEIHRGGGSWDGHSDDKGSVATFKWSRDAVAFPIQSLSGTTVTLESLGRDDRFGLEVGDWVEVTDDDYVLLGKAEPLLRVEKIDRIDMLVTLSGAPNYGRDSGKHPLLRRWDQQPGDPATGGLQLGSDGTAFILGSPAWLNLEDGVQVQFRNGPYRTGDYWSIPARTVTGDVEWPGTTDDPLALPPRGIDHHYAPLALVLPEGNKVTDLRHSIAPIGSCCPKIEVLNPPTWPRASPTVKVGPIPFSARVSSGNTNLRYTWSLLGGRIVDGENTASITAAPNDEKSDVVIAVVVIEGLPGDCPNSTMGACAIVKEPS